MTVPPNMQNPNMGMTDPSGYKWGEKGIPTRENCDLNDPKEMFLWMFTALPGVNGAPLILPPPFWMLVSEHQFELGAMLKCESCGHEKTPVKKYRPPTSNDPHWMTSPGQWVPIDTPDPQPHPAQRAWDSLSPVQKAEIFELAKREHENDPQ